MVIHPSGTASQMCPIVGHCELVSYPQEYQIVNGCEQRMARRGARVIGRRMASPYWDLPHARPGATMEPRTTTAKEIDVASFNIMQGGAKKAFAGSIGAVLSAEIISPFIDWGFDIIEARWFDVPDAVEASTSVLVIAGIGFLVSLLAPANNLETAGGAVVKPQDAHIIKA